LHPGRDTLCQGIDMREEQIYLFCRVQKTTNVTLIAEKKDFLILF
jgi:hypothetical protein